VVFIVFWKETAFPLGAGLENIMIFLKISKISKKSDFFSIFLIFSTLYQSFAHTWF